jgi:hypothetical protein
MKRVLAVILVLVAVVIAATIYLLRSEAAPSAATLLSDSTLLFVEMPDFRRAETDFQHTALYDLWKEPEVQKFLEEPLKALGQWGSLGATENKVRDSILDAIQGEAFAAITRISILPSPQVGAVFGVDTKSSLLKAKATLAYYEHELHKSNPGVKFDSKKYLGITYSTWELTGNQTLCHTFLNSMLVFTLGEDEMHDVITRFKGQAPAGTRSLAASDPYQSILHRLPADHEFVSYLNVEQIVGLVGPLLAFMPQTSAAFGQMSRVQATAWSFSFVDKQIHDVGLTVYNVTNSPSPATQRKTLALTTPQTSFYAVQSVDCAGAYRQVMDSVARSGSEAAVSNAIAFDRKLRSNGIRPREDLLASLGPETAIIGKWRDGATLPDVAIAVEAGNLSQTRPRIDLALRALKDATLGGDAQSLWDDIPYQGETLHTVHIGSSLVAPTYVVTDSFLILALTPDYARELLGQLKQPKPMLDSSASYQQAMKPLPTSACAYGYYDLAALFRPLYTRLRAFATTDNTGWLGLNKLPQTETIARHLTPFVTATVSDAQSQTSTSYSPLGKPITFLIVGAGGLMMAEPYLSNYLPMLSLIAPRMSSDTVAPAPPPGNQTGASQSPPTR